MTPRRLTNHHAKALPKGKQAPKERRTTSSFHHIMLGPFVLCSLIGRGGMSEVWQGFHRTKGTPVAIKIASASSPDSARHQCPLYDEAQRLAQLKHPAIIDFFDYGTIPQEVEEASRGQFLAGGAYMVLELAEHALDPYCGQISWPLLLRVFLSLLDALSHVHANGIIHRDIKPSNLLISKDFHYIKLTDFGIAYEAARHNELYRRNAVLGTPSYMAPEQFRGKHDQYGPWTDLYAFGCTAYELLTGAPPFGHGRFLETMRAAHLREDPPDLPEHLEVPSDLNLWLHQLLAKAPSERFQKASDASHALFSLSALAAEGTQGDETLPDLPVIISPRLILQEGIELTLLPTLVATQPIETLTTTIAPLTLDETQNPPTEPPGE